MDPLLIALLAVVVVIGGVLVLRLHAFLALTAGALLVALLTPSERLYNDAIREAGLTVTRVEQARLFFVDGRQPVPGRNVVFRAAEATQRLTRVGSVLFANPDESGDSFAIETIGPGVVPQPGDLLVHEIAEAAAKKASQLVSAGRVAAGFGDTCGKIGILIAMASIIGTCLLESGAAESVVSATRRLVGDRRTPLAFTISGFVVGIPVFFDTVFYLLMPLAKAMRLRTGGNYLLYVMSIVVGATMAHSLVPPTPGPLFVAAEMNVSVGMMMLAGTAVGLIAVVSGYVYVLWANRHWEIPLRDTETVPSETASEQPLPPLWLALLPILLPVALLAGKAILDARAAALGSLPSGSLSAKPAIDFLGDKNVALIFAAAIALATLAWQKRRSAKKIDMLQSVQSALSSGGVIILITAAGGAFGHVLRQSGVAPAIQQRFPITEGGFMLLCVAFGVTALVRFAQGSATVAMITAVGIISPLAANIALPYHPVYLALAIGCGSKPLAWMNDSGFWVVGRMSGMTESETLKIHSVTLTIMGVVGFLATLLGARFLPLV